VFESGKASPCLRPCSWAECWKVGPQVPSFLRTQLGLVPEPHGLSHPSVSLPISFQAHSAAQRPKVTRHHPALSLPRSGGRQLASKLPERT
jgi:hypothetical protein